MLSVKSVSACGALKLSSEGSNFRRPMNGNSRSSRLSLGSDSLISRWSSPDTLPSRSSMGVKVPPRLDRAILSTLISRCPDAGDCAASSVKLALSEPSPRRNRTDSASSWPASRLAASVNSFRAKPLGNTSVLALSDSRPSKVRSGARKDSFSAPSLSAGVVLSIS